ncbi:MAG: hypothetical protein K2Z81_26900, partial [Cyanobacteria bacterium]|nr:hypothetical protein [Cyanobacteriota bacterium]
MFLQTGRSLLLISLLTMAGLSLPVNAADLSDQDKEDIDRMVIRYKAAVGMNPNNPETRLKLGQAYLMSNNLAGAIEQFEAAKKL